MRRRKHPCFKKKPYKRHYEQKPVELIKEEFAEHGIEAYQVFIDFEREYGGFVIKGKNDNWYLRLDPFENFTADGILFVEFAVICVAGPYFYYLNQNGQVYAGMNKEEWEIASSLNEFLEEYI